MSSGSDTSHASTPVTASSAGPARFRLAMLPLPTVGVFLAIAMTLWINAAVNRYRFNLAIAILGSIPLAILLLREAKKARGADPT